MARHIDGLGSSSSSASRDIDRAEQSTNRFARTAGGSTAQIDRYSGRLGLLADAAITLGPALIPLGASTIPVLTASLAGLGAAAGGIGVAILAFKNLGDGIKALDAYNLSPTVANLEKLRQVEQQLGPAGTEFLRFVDGLEPQLKNLQNLARAGLFPGVEAGITDLLQRLPLVRGVVKSLSEEMGTLAAEAGHSLSSSEWRPFFQYVRAEAAPTLDAFAHSAGNVALGLANLLVAFDPLSRSFTGGLEQMTASFAEWSKHLDTNAGFQSFLAYVAQEGPRAVAFLSALGHAIIAITKAAQPWGDLVLSALIPVLKVFDALASSKAGPALYATAAAMIVYSRAATVASAAQGKLAGVSNVAIFGRTAAAIGLAAAATSNWDDKLGLANTTMDSLTGAMIGGAAGAGIGAGVGLFQDITKASDSWTASLKNSEAALQSHDLTTLQTQLKAVNDELDQMSQAHKGFGDLGLDVFSPSHIGDQFKVGLGEILGLTPKVTASQKELIGAMREGGSVADIFGHDIGLTAKQMAVASGDAKSLSGALADLNGWFDKRQALRDYQADIKSLSKALKDGFQPKDAETLDTLGRGIIQVASDIKDPGTRNNFLEGARKQLEVLANSAGPKAQGAIQRVIDKLDSEGLTHPKPTKLTADTSDVDKKAAHTKKQFDIMSALSAKPKIDANDDPFLQTYGTVKQAMRQADALRAAPHVTVDPGNSFSILGTIRAAIASIHDKTVTIRTVHAGGFGPQPAAADGGTVPKSGLPYADRYTYRLADGEEIISNRYGQADHFRADRAAGRIPGYADGGTTGGHSGGGGSHSYTDLLPIDLIHDLGGAAHVATLSLHEFVKQMTELDKQLNRKLNRDEKELKKAQTADQTAHSNLDSLTSTIASSLGLDSIYTKSQASSTPWMAGASGGSFNIAGNANKVAASANTFVANIKTLQGKGVTGAALQALISQGPEVLAAVAAMSAADLSSTVSAITAASAAVATASSYGGGAVFGGQVASADKHLDAIRDEVRKLRQDVKAADAANKAGHKASAHAASTAGSNAAAAARRRGRGH